MLARAHLPKLSKLSNRNSLMEAKTHKNKMKNKEEIMNRCRYGLEELFIVIWFLNSSLWLLI
jgi:hypothetical protein